MLDLAKQAQSVLGEACIYALDDKMHHEIVVVAQTRGGCLKIVEEVSRAQGFKFERTEQWTSDFGRKQCVRFKLAPKK